METSSALYELASVSLACRDQDTLLKTFAARVGAVLAARSVFIWIYDTESEGLVCRTRWTEPGERIAPLNDPVGDGLLFEIYESGGSRLVSAEEIAEGGFEHLDETSRPRVKTALIASLPGDHSNAGVVEVINRRTGEFTADQAHFLEEASRFVGHAFSNLRAIEEERHAQLFTLERLTALYDLGRTFTSTLELEQLLPVVAGKIRDILPAGACNLWLADSGSEDMYLARKVGEDPTIEEGARAPLADGLLGDIAQKAAPKLVEDASSETWLAERQANAPDGFEIASWMGVPLRKDDQVLGVVEIVNKADGGSFNEEDLFFLASISEQAAVALHNANLLEAERKVSALDALLKISQEITSTLDLDHVLTTVVHQASSVVPFERCVIGFYDRSKFILGAVSGETEVPKTREMSDFRTRLEWVAQQDGPVSADLYDDGWHVSPEDAKAQVVPFLEAHDHNGFYGLPLRDDQGRLGAMALLSGDADFLTESNRETVGILANQTTVAIRNAQLYQQVPLANLLQPFSQRKKKLLSAMPRSRWGEYLQRAALIIGALVLIPWPLRVSTDATVISADRRVVSAIGGGVIEKVYVHEGDTVTAEQILAQLDDSEDRVKLAQSEEALSQSRHELADSEFRNDPSAAGQATIQTNLHQAEVDLETQRVADSVLRAPIAGVIVTPKIEDKTGTFLHAGDAFAEIVAQDRMAIELSVPETDLGLVKTGAATALKLNAFPTVTFHGAVDRLGASTHGEAGDQYFLVRSTFENTGVRARSGMVGRARVSAGGGWFGSGWYPVGYVIFRPPFRWVWEKVWGLLP